MNIIGLMSGTSVDGLDLACVNFNPEEPNSYKLICCETLEYNEEWRQRLQNAIQLNESELKTLHSDYGIWLGETVLQFIRKHQLKVELIASHGHTVFHQPNIKRTLQIGSGQKLHEITKLPVVNNFREQDVILGGQGAPLVPIGDAKLFSSYEFCLNLGGFSNVSWNQQGLRKACDISVCNMLLNEICKRISLMYDKEGRLARMGKVIPDLLEKWNQIAFYKQEAPKSLGREWFADNYLTDLQNMNYDTSDLLNTAHLHIATQIAKFISGIAHHADIKRNITILTTGGGAHNSYLIELLKKQDESLNFIIPDSQLIDFKEAIVFALLGYLRWRNEININSSVTGAIRDHSSGDIYS